MSVVLVIFVVGVLITVAWKALAILAFIAAIGLEATAVLVFIALIVGIL